ncbi:MAG TPA: adenine deaminase C-terminal domain-containing protein, partial [Chitinophagaceae bacterium]
GKLVAENGKTRIESLRPEAINNFSCELVSKADIQFHANVEKENVLVIEAIDGQLITNKISQSAGQLKSSANDLLLGSNPGIDILKIVVVNRYVPAKPAISFIKNFGLKKGALASSVAHDSHNIVAVGADDENICKAINKVIEHKGGVSFVNGDKEMIVPLPIAGLMSNEDGYKIARQYSLIDKAVKEEGCSLFSPFMTLSFMALLVIPHLKLSDLGLFDGDKFELIH